MDPLTHNAGDAQQISGTASSSASLSEYHGWVDGRMDASMYVCM